MTEKLKNALIDRYGAKCYLYGEEYPARLLQPDHRVPYEIGGDPIDMLNTDYFMLLSPSANRDKSWACEHCPNWTEKNIEMCQTCYYAYPEEYQHIAGVKEKKLDIIFNNEDISLFNEIVKEANLHKTSYQSVVKRIIKYYHRINDE